MPSSYFGNRGASSSVCGGEVKGLENSESNASLLKFGSNAKRKNFSTLRSHNTT